MGSKSRTVMKSICCCFICFLVAIFVLRNTAFYSGNENTTTHVYMNHRKLGLQETAGICSKWDISISQSRYPSSGIPQYIVQLVNTCASGCAPSNIHLHCGWFASARIVNPRSFKRVSFDDCLVNGGHPLKNSKSIRFTYANSFMYPLQFKSAHFC